MVRWLMMVCAVLAAAGCNWSELVGQGSHAHEAYYYSLSGQAISAELQQQLIRWISYSGGKYTADAAQAQITLEIISEKMTDRTISVNALGQPLLCEKTAAITYRLSRLSESTLSETLTARTSMLYRRENDRETSLEYQNIRLQEKLAEDVSRYVSLQLTAWNQKHATDH